jgi:ribokinase
VLVPNESEAMVLAGQAASDSFDHERVLDALHMTGVRAVLITLGAQGVLYSDRTTQLRRQAYATHAVDTSGAGDAFIGAFAAGVVSGSPLERAIDFAQRAASVSVSRHDAMASLPYKYEID